MQTNLQDQKKKLISELLKKGVLLDPREVRQANAETELSTIYKKATSPPKTRQEPPTVPATTEPSVEVNYFYHKEVRKREVDDFVNYYRKRYEAIEKLLVSRAELRSTISIRRVLMKKDKETTSIIGMVSQKDITKNGNIILTVEDPTGAIKVLINKNKPELFDKAQDIVLDEVIGVVGANGQNIIFANDVVWPDIPYTPLKKCSEEVYAAFLSDLHVGSKKFLAEDFQRFIDWTNGNIGTQAQKDIAKKTKYLFVVGDLVDGIGIYPGQQAEQDITSIQQQYHKCAELLRQLPPHIHIILCPGNHDAVRLSEPQPAFLKQYSQALFDLPNTTLVSNPSLVTIHRSEHFSGFSVLLYHGYSFDHYVAEVNSLRNRGGYDRGDLVMKFLLQRRHLAPTHTSTLYIPDPLRDNLVISSIPDFFVSGHIHKSVSANYKNTTLICGSCWQSKTPFQEKVGHHPEPSRVPLANLKTREVKILKFGQ